MDPPPAKPRRRNRRGRYASRQKAQQEKVVYYSTQDELTAPETEPAKPASTERTSMTLFIQNLPFTTSALQLKNYITGVLQQQYTNIDPITQCALVKDNKVGMTRSKGCANVRINSVSPSAESLFQLLQSMQLSIGGRALRVSVSNRIETESFSLNAADLFPCSLAVGNGEASSELFQFSESNCTFRFERSASRSFEIAFPIRDSKFRVASSFRRLGDLSLEHVAGTRIAMRFRLRQPPSLEEMYMSQAESDFYWFGEERWDRALDPTRFSTKIFSRCKTYLVIFEAQHTSAILRILTSIGVNPSAQMSTLRQHLTEMPATRSVDENTVSEAVKQYASSRVFAPLPRSVLYLLEVVFSGSQVDPISSLLENITSQDPFSELKRIVNVLLSVSSPIAEQTLLYISNDSSIYYLHNLADYIEDSFANFIEELEYLASFESDNKCVRRVYPTPLRVVVRPPAPELSNRVLDQFKEWKHRFIRVCFVDENFGSTNGYSEAIYSDMVAKVMSDGIDLCYRHFSFLAYSNSQLREHSCWFYDAGSLDEQDPPNRAAPSIHEIYQSIGDLSSIAVAGKFGARLGQGFSSHMVSIPLTSNDISVIHDVERNGYCFSDGIGTISVELAKHIAHTLTLRYVPSSFQVRIGGIKGMLTVDPKSINKVCIRPSMKKFESSSFDLNVVSYSRPMPFYFNRQIIPLLSNLKINDNTFISLQDNMTTLLQKALIDPSSALQMLVWNTQEGVIPVSLEATDFTYLGGISHSTSIVVKALKSGFNHCDDSFLHSIVTAVVDRLTLDLVNKARVIVPDAVCLIGVLDEYGVLEQDEVYVSFDVSGSGRLILDEFVMVGRNPSLHPGDIRRLKAVTRVELQHLTNVIIFPQKGNRPKPDEMSGGDLDGDIFFVIYDRLLIAGDNHAPMQYSDQKNFSSIIGGASFQKTLSDVLESLRDIIPSGTSIQHAPDKAVSCSDLSTFFVHYMQNDNLGQIATAHMVFADMNGINCKECIELCQLHSDAVDFPKKGIPAVIPRHLRYSQCPDFMEKNNKIKYESHKALGQMYRKAKAFQRVVGRTIPAMKVVPLLSVSGANVFEDDAIGNCETYIFAVWPLMNQFDVYNEGELLSGFVAKYARKQSKEKDNDVQGRINLAVKHLRQEYTNLFWGEFIAASEVDESLSAETKHRVRQKAIAWYSAAYSFYDPVYPILSFAWIAWQVNIDILLSTKPAMVNRVI